MNLSIKAVLPEPERKPKAKTNENAEESHKTRPAKKNDDELSNWSEGSISNGTSIADIVASKKQ
jgi:hypothetical protein